MEAQFCPACKNEHIIGNANCMICDFPFEGSDKEKSIHIGKFIGKKGIIQDSENSLDKSRNVLFFVAILNIVGIAINYEVVFQNIIVAIISFLIPTIIIASALLIKKAPLVFLGIPLFLMLFVYGIEIVLNPTEWYRGIMLKLFVLGLLSYSMYIYIASNKFKKRYNQ
ncbi:hypothetical protein ACFQ1Q_01365 [Winogradskyella litorisediminis]|uniref:Uncharacterized protein n=1 Tax=Winogradskyella litorisediminis TaxID=1156618 RepID=A0ABW3N2F7_9FLAO